MRIVQDTPNLLVIEDRPVVLGTVLGAMVVMLLGLAFLTFAAEPWLALGGSLGAALLGVAFAAFVRRVFVAFDRAAGSVVIRSASIFGQTEEQLPLSEIIEAMVDTTASLDSPGSKNRNTQTHRPVLRLKGGRLNQPLTKVFSGGKGAAKIVDAINRWLAA